MVQKLTEDFVKGYGSGYYAGIFNAIALYLPLTKTIRKKLLENLEKDYLPNDKLIEKYLKGRKK